MNNKSSVFTMLGFFKKSGKIVSGDKAVNALLKKNQVAMLIIAEDLSDTRKTYWKHIAHNSDITIYVFGTKIELGIAIGASPRGIVGITDSDMALALEKKL